MGASARAQARALFVKSAVYQRRNTATNFCLLVAPVFFCGLLALLQTLSNKLILNQRDNMCGCQCTSCCLLKKVQRPWTDAELQRIATGEKLTPKYQEVEQCGSLDYGVCEKSSQYKCREYNDANCSIKFSSSRQAVFCPIPEPSSWPPILQTPRLGNRAGGATSQWLPFTGSNMTEARAVAANLASAPELPNVQPLVDQLGVDPLSLLSMKPEQVVELLLPMLTKEGLVKGEGEAVDAAQLSRLGLSFGSALRAYSDYYLESAFINSNTDSSRLQFLVPNGECASTGISNVTHYQALPLAEMILRYYNATYPLIVAPILKAFNVTSDTLTAGTEGTPLSEITSACVEMVPREAANLTALNRRLYCGFGASRCDGTYFVREYGGAWDFRELSSTKLNYSVFYNLSLPLAEAPRNYRIPELLNMATQAWTRTYWDRLPVVYRVRNRLLGLMSFPKLRMELKMDFSIVLGPLFYTWVVQMLLPTFLQLLVYEKEKRLRMMMKMHGLGDGAYWLVTYLWYLALYVVYIIFFMVFGSLIGLKIFTYNSYAVQGVLYFIFGNNMIAFVFMLSSFFASSRTATVVAFLYVFAAGLIGELLLHPLMRKGHTYLMAVELLPGFALYRGLMEFSEYSLRAIFANTPGLRWRDLGDPGNGMLGAWAILALEWPAFMLLGWYLEQVSSTGTGVRRHPLFFIRGMWHKHAEDLSELKLRSANWSSGPAALAAAHSSCVHSSKNSSSGGSSSLTTPPCTVVVDNGEGTAFAPGTPAGAVRSRVPVAEGVESGDGAAHSVSGEAGSNTGVGGDSSSNASATGQGGEGAGIGSGLGGGGAAEAASSGRTLVLTGQLRRSSDGGGDNATHGCGGRNDGSSGPISRSVGSIAGSVSASRVSLHGGGSRSGSGSGPASASVPSAAVSVSPSRVSLQDALNQRTAPCLDSPRGSSSASHPASGTTRLSNPVFAHSPAASAGGSSSSGSRGDGSGGCGGSSAEQSSTGDTRIAVHPAPSTPVKANPGNGDAVPVVETPSPTAAINAAARIDTTVQSSSSDSSICKDANKAGSRCSGGGGGVCASSPSSQISTGAAARIASTIVIDAFDVIQEAERVEAFDAERLAATPIVVRRLAKVFPAIDGGGAACGAGDFWHCCGGAQSRVRIAVRTLTLGIDRGECFGLLGPNGAGKTTTINMLTGFLEPSAGDAVVEGLSVRTDMHQIYRLMGVCPQHDLLWEQLTGEEHLRFYGRLKGLKGEALEAAVDAAIRSVKLHHNDAGRRQVRAYSGGMKRRLSVAISFIGDPKVVYLDEPSTGLDPASRRALWDVVRENKAGRAIILTTHSMEEAEILCDRLGIFVDGQLVCIGNPREITSRYAGYLVFTITVGPGHEDAAQEVVKHMSPNARLTYALGTTFKYELPVSDVTLARVFDAMGTAKTQMQVLDWGVANATLEEVFIKFARQIGAETRET